MDKSTIRPYEMSVWSLRDSFLAALKTPGIENKGHIQEPKLTLNIDGTQELTFKVPMYYFEDNQMVENPYWYDIKNGLLLIGMRKIKLIFNKNSRDEEVYEFIVTDVSEEHADDGTLFCEVTGSGLAFQELGKKGYKISLSEDDYYNDINNYYDALDSGEEPEKPINNINYWCDKVFKNLDWDYSIQMDWSDYDGILYRRVYDPREELYYGIELIYAGLTKDNAALGTAEAGLLRLGNNGTIVNYGPRVGLAIVDYSRLTDDEIQQLEDLYHNNFLGGEFVSYQDLTPFEQAAIDEWREQEGRENLYRSNRKIYEDEYVTSWHVDEENHMLVPVEYEKFKEKCRMVNESESNVYNLTQAIAEQFGVFCKYKYYYDENYHIIRKEVIFYNSFTNEFNDTLDLNYGYNTSSITRKMDSNDLCTKLIVKSVDDDSSLLGTLSIINTAANRSGEDYILNFEYLHETGAIEDDQYEEVKKFETDMRIYNNSLINLSDTIGKLETQLVEERANEELANNMYAQCEDQYNEAKAQYNYFISQIGNNGIATRRTPVIVQEDKLDNKYIDLYNEEKGITQVSLYSNYTYSTAVNSFSTVKDENNYIIKISNISSNVRQLYLQYSYQPQSYYQKLADKFYKLRAIEGEKRAAAQKAVNDIEEQLDSLNEEYKNLLNKKDLRIEDFEKMVGPALREGSWQPEEYNDYGDHYSKSFTMSFTNQNEFFWDEKLFDDETLNYEEEGIEQNKVYYPFIIVDANTIKNYVASENGYLEFRTTLSVNGSNTVYNYSLGATMEIAFLKKNNNIYTVLLLNGLDGAEQELLFNNGQFQGTNSKLYFVNFTTDPVSDDPHFNISINNNAIHFGDANTYTIVYPRFYINELSLLTAGDTLRLLVNNDMLDKYYDYYLLTREDGYYVTLNPEIAVKYFNSIFNIEYTLSNAELNIYLDAKEVSKTNAYPQVSYEMTVAAIDADLMKTLYKQLNRLASVNDFELKFENVKGYVSNLELDLDQPWEDEIEIKNYKTKFEDLFTKIVATTEQMRANALVYDKAAAAFNSAGEIKETILQSSIMDAIDLNLAFNKGALTMNEAEGIRAESEDGIVAFSGGGLFCATERDTDGNWIWHTGIVPSGINASLITAGQINTNLIKIYAGDNLRFQMNGDGLFAYNNDKDQYVVHNEDGLFLVAKEGYHVKDNPSNNDLTNYKIDGSGNLTQDIERVSISWDGIKLKNYNDETVFSADANTGNLSIKGNINAIGGTIGGWTIGTNILSYLSTLPSSSSMILSPSGVISSTAIGGSSGSKNWAFTIKNKFGVTTAGDLFATGANISGAITATSLTLGSNVSIPSNKVSGLDIYISKDGTVGSATLPTTNTSSTIEGTAFKVSSAGLLQAANAVIYGTIFASSGKIGGWTLASNMLYTGSQNPGDTNTILFSPTGINGTTPIAGSGNQSWVMTAKNNFGVTTSGVVYATGAYFNSVNINGNTNIYTDGNISINGNYLRMCAIEDPDALYGITSGLYIKKAGAENENYPEFAFKASAYGGIRYGVTSAGTNTFSVNCYNSSILMMDGAITLQAGDFTHNVNGSIVLDAGEVCFRKDNTEANEGLYIRLVVSRSAPSHSSYAKGVLWIDTASAHPTSWETCVVKYKEF